MQQYIFGFGAIGFFITFSFRLIWNIHLNVYFIASSYLVENGLYIQLYSFILKVFKEEFAALFYVI